MDKSKTHHCKLLDEIVFKASSNPLSVIVISDASIKNNIITFIIYIHTFNSPLKKTLHHAINIIFTKAKLFTIQCGINQAIHFPNISCIIIIIDTIMT